ncbi:unnamed protein product, partial [Discosporangium mesarthrocarpum]
VGKNTGHHGRAGRGRKLVLYCVLQLVSLVLVRVDGIVASALYFFFGHVSGGRLRYFLTHLYPIPDTNTNPNPGYCPEPDPGPNLNTFPLPRSRLLLLTLTLAVAPNLIMTPPITLAVAL